MAANSAAPKPRTILRDVDRAFIQAVMFQCGIIPMEKTELDMQRALSQLPPEEARVLKRKFRKLWRKAMRAEVGMNSSKSGKMRKSAAESRLGVGKNVPSRTERNARKKLVFETLWNDYIYPLIEKFENPSKEENSQEKGK